MESFYPYAIPALWALWVVYWALSAANVKTTQRREPLTSRALHFVPMILAAALVSIPRLPGLTLLSDRFVPPNNLTQGGGCVLTLTGLSFSVWARIHLGRNWSGRITLKQDHELIQTGPYASVRHPIYTGLLLALAGTALSVGEWRGVLALLLMLVSFWRKLKLEERWMNEVFGDRYERYRQHTPALVPFLR